MRLTSSRTLLLFLAGLALVGGAALAAESAKKAAKTEAAKPADKTRTPAEAAAPAAPTASTVPVALTVEYGKAAAPITIEEFASLSCSHCAEFAKSGYPELKKKYLDSGKARLVTHSYIRNEPDMRGTMLLHCLKSNEERQQFIKVLFDMQEQWAFAENVIDSLGDIAKVGGMSQEAYLACVKDPTLETGLLKDLQSLSETRDISGTPTFYINGVKHTGPFDATSLGKAIDAAKPAKPADAAK